MGVPSFLSGWEFAVNGHQQLAANARRVEGRGPHVGQTVGRLAEIGVLACGHQAVVALHRGQERGLLVGVELHHVGQRL